MSHFTDVKDTDTDVTDLIDTLHVLSQRMRDTKKVVSLYHKLIYVNYFILLVLLQT